MERPVRRLHADRFRQLTDEQLDAVSPTGVSKNRFISGLSTAADDDPRATYFPLKNNGTPTTARAGIAFPGNDWRAFPDGDQYLANVGGTSQLLNELAALRQKHLAAIANLLDAIADDRVDVYLNHQFRCPN